MSSMDDPIGHEYRARFLRVLRADNFSMSQVRLQDILSQYDEALALYMPGRASVTFRPGWSEQDDEIFERWLSE